MARMCGVLKIALREDDPGGMIRLAPEDVLGEVGADGKPIETGLYACSRDALERFGPRVIARRVEAGELPEGTTWQSAGYKQLM